MAFTLPNLPYPEDALAPHISSQTMQFHHGKHHAGYVKKLNSLIEGTSYEGKSLEQIIKESYGKEEDTAIFNNAAQSWNHTFFWHSMSPSGGGQPTDAAAEVLKDLGGPDAFRTAFLEAAVGQFGSGWTWLVLDGGKPKIMATSNAMTPIAEDRIPLLTCDVWEHAYYLDYQNRRESFVSAFLDHLVNWNLVAAQLKKAA
jgi:Fe-Mn family superoxide dismutase